MKRIFDVVASFAGLVVFSPLMLAVAVLVRRSSPGGALFLQQRVGRNEVPFTCIKFRTMAHGTPDVGSHHAQTAWITPLGKTLRRYKLDELPQLFNVLRGDMSLVGPRPCLPVQAEVIHERRKRGVFSIRPGITGLAQLSGIDMSTPEALAIADERYVRNHGLAGDIRLIISTVLGRGSGDAATGG